MTATPQAAQRPDTNEMKVIHRVFRREFTALPALVRGVRDGDTERSAVVGAHLQQMLWFLRIHHEGEDELLWPLLLDRATLQADLVHRMESQHQVVAALIGKATALLPEWTATASAAAGDSLATLLGELTAPLFEHLGGPLLGRGAGLGAGKGGGGDGERPPELEQVARFDGERELARQRRRLAVRQQRQR